MVDFNNLKLTSKYRLRSLQMIWFKKLILINSNLKYYKKSTVDLKMPTIKNQKITLKKILTLSKEKNMTIQWVNFQKMKIKKTHLKHLWLKIMPIMLKRKIKSKKDKDLTVANWLKMTKAAHTVPHLITILRKMSSYWKETQPTQLTAKATSSLLSSLAWWVAPHICQIITKEWLKQMLHQDFQRKIK